MELITKLGIDVRLISAQIINFLILFFVLYKFVYKPILDLLEKRSKTIEKGIKDAKESEQKLVEITRHQEEKMAQTEKEVGKILDGARKDAEAMKKQVVEAAQKQSEEIMRRTQIQVADEKAKMIAEVKSEVGNFVINLTEKILHREFSANDQKRLADAISEEMKASVK